MSKPGYRFRLFVAGARPQSTRAIANLSRLCAKHLAGRHDIEVLDILHHRDIALKERIIAAPTLVKTAPGDEIRLIGDLSDERRFLAALALPSELCDA